MSTSIYTPFFYIVCHKPSNKFFVGTRTSKTICPKSFCELSVNFTSDKIVQKMIKNDGIDSFKILAIRVFETKEETLKFYNNFLSKHNCKSSDKFINRNNVRTKDKKPRKTDNYSKSAKKRFEDPNYRNKFFNSIKESRKSEKYFDPNIELYQLDELKIILKEITKNWSQGTNRKIFKNKKVFASILHFTKDMILYGDKISEKIYRLIHNVQDPICEECGHKKKFNTIHIGYSDCGNRDCNALRTKIKTGQKRFFENLTEDQRKELNRRKYTIETREKMSKSAKRRVADKNKFRVKSSKAANAFFNELLNLGYMGKCDLNEGEVRFNVLHVKTLNNSVIFVDFTLGNKIIEYDGDYWHKDKLKNDAARDEYLNEIGYEVLRIKHSDVIKNKEKEMCKSISFLEGK